MSLVSPADELLRSKAHQWLWKGIFSVAILHVFEMSLFLLLLTTVKTLLPILSDLGIFLWMKGEKNNDSFGLAESLRSFVPKEIRKFIKCAPAEILKGNRKCLSFIFIHEALEGDGKGDWRLGDQAHLQADCADTSWLASPGCLC